jgi:hypothetical protein
MMGKGECRCRITILLYTDTLKYAERIVTLDRGHGNMAEFSYIYEPTRNVT